MIPQIILAVGVALAAIFYVAPNLGSISTGILGEIMAPITLGVGKLFQLLGYLAPFLIAVVPLYIIYSNRRPGEDDGVNIYMGMAYGLVLYCIALFTGVDQMLIQEMRGSMMVGSTLGMAVSSLGAAANYLAGAFVSIALWGAGILLSIVGAFLDALVGVGQAAEAVKRPVNRGRASILDRLLGRGSQ